VGKGAKKTPTSVLSGHGGKKKLGGLRWKKVLKTVHAQTENGSRNRPRLVKRTRINLGFGPFGGAAPFAYAPTSRKTKEQKGGRRGGEMTRAPSLPERGRGKNRADSQIKSDLLARKALANKRHASAKLLPKKKKKKGRTNIPTGKKVAKNKETEEHNRRHRRPVNGGREKNSQASEFQKKKNPIVRVWTGTSSPS